MPRWTMTSGSSACTTRIVELAITLPERSSKIRLVSPKALAGDDHLGAAVQQPSHRR